MAFLRTAIIIVSSCGIVSSFSPSICSSHHIKLVASPNTKLYSAMECLHHPSKPYPVEHVYSLKEIEQITNKIANDEWAALGSVIAEQMLEMILDVGDEALAQRPGVDRMMITDKIAEEISNDVEKTLYKIRSESSSSSNAFDQEHHLPEQLLSSLETLLRHELGTIIGLDGTNSQLKTDGHNLSI